MKMKLYTKGHNVNLLKEIDNNGRQFTAEEHAYVTEKEFGDSFLRSRENLLRYYLSNNSAKLEALDFLIRRATGQGYENILSLGAGYSVLEYLLKLALPEMAKIAVTDFDAYVIEKVRLFFPEIIVLPFDLFKDDVKDIARDLKLKFDLAVFFSSAYVLDDAQFIKVFKDLRMMGVKEIIDFHAGYIDMKRVFYNLIDKIKSNGRIRKICGKSPIEVFRGKFHGYGRDRSELKKLYHQAGFHVEQEVSLKSYKYVAILR